MAATPLKIAIAPDSFKGNLSAAEAATCIDRGLRKALTNIKTLLIPMADGGEGTVAAMVAATGGKILRRKVTGPRGKQVTAFFGLTGDGNTAIIEMAAASGLALIRPSQHNPMLTTTYGTGQLIEKALASNVRRMLVGIGGSATNDGGTGMARALGARFLDRNGSDLPEGGGALCKLAHIDLSGLDPRLSKVKIEVACDVDNPLTGACGAAAVYAPQKGATPSMVKHLEQGLRTMARVIRKDLTEDIERVPGAGAAGGLGAGLMAYLGAKLRPGVDIVTDALELSHKLKGFDLVITGEGKLDGQAIYGKTPIGVARVAQKLDIPVIAIAGCIDKDVKKVQPAGIDAYFSALEITMDDAEVHRNAGRMLTDCAEQVGRLLGLKIRNRNNARLKKKGR